MPRTASALTLASVRASVRALGFTLRNTGWGSSFKPEYRLARPGRGNEAAAYYSDDLADILATARTCFLARSESQAEDSRCNLAEFIGS